jgi:ArsR family transcriptional regulator
MIKPTFMAPDLADGTELLPEPLPAARAESIAATFRALGDPVRLRMFSLVGTHPDGVVGLDELTAASDLSTSTVTRHLEVLTSAGLLAHERSGTQVGYRVSAAAVAELVDVVFTGSYVHPSWAPASLEEASNPSPESRAPTQ